MLILKMMKEEIIVDMFVFEVKFYHDMLDHVINQLMFEIH